MYDVSEDDSRRRGVDEKGNRLCLFLTYRVTYELPHLTETVGAEEKAC